MHVRKIFQTTKPALSFEFFPAKTDEADQKLRQQIVELQALEPDFVSVTYGAGGGTRDRTNSLVHDLQHHSPLNPVPHLTCVCHTEDEIREIVEGYAKEQISNILALGGDPPRHMKDYDRSQDAFQHAIDLVKFIRRFNEEGRHPSPDGFGIGVAGFPEGHPATPNRVKDLDHLKEKCDAGADYICTQLFFDNNDFFDFVERCRIIGINIPIVAGVLPVSSHGTFKRLPDLAAGSRYPAPLFKRIVEANENDEEIAKVGVEWATEQVRDLIDRGVDGIHFYTLNQAAATRKIFEDLNLRSERTAPTA
jgi:methylenetetrahydrofolate reductase (NADPH)